MQLLSQGWSSKDQAPLPSLGMQRSRQGNSGSLRTDSCRDNEKLNVGNTKSFHGAHCDSPRTSVPDLDLLVELYRLVAADLPPSNRVSARELSGVEAYLSDRLVH